MTGTETVPGVLRHPFVGICFLLFVASGAVTVVWSTSMSDMAAMPMPGGWTMTMVWMRASRQTWPGAAATFLGMWIVMTAAMMLPSLVPVLWRYRESIDRSGDTRRGWPLVLAGVGYFVVWTVFGLAAYVIGVLIAILAMRHPALSHAMPLAAGAVLVIAGALQFAPWKHRHLACWRQASGTVGASPAAPATAWRHGVRLGLLCAGCCANLMAVLLAAGVMNLRAMAAVTVAITIERLATRGERFARVIGGIVIAAGLVLLARLALA
jgi:predicted metal-binding membrane protein